MQTNNDTVKNVHIKVQCENEFRRFVLSEVTYTNLAATIRSLLAFPPETDFKMSYLDDEGDKVLFATDNELLYAVALSKSPLKIFVKTCTANATPQPVKLTVAPTVAEGETVLPEENTWRGRGGRGRGCGRGRGGRVDWSERLDAKIARLTERHAVLTAKLIENDFPEEKVRGIEWRLSHLQNKIDTLKSKKEQLGDLSAVKNKEENQKTETARDEHVTPTPENDDAVHPWHTRGRRGCRGGGRGRGGSCHRGEGEEGCERKRGAAWNFAHSTPEGQAAFEKVQAAKEALMAARRDKEGKEVILAKIEELKAAKANWRDLKLALWKENRAAAAPRKEAK